MPALPSVTTRLAICGPVAGNSSNSKPNFDLNELSSSFLSSVLGGIPTTTFPSFFAAARAFSHSVCQVVCAWPKSRTAIRKTKLHTTNKTNPRVILLFFLRPLRSFDGVYPEHCRRAQDRLCG